MQVQLTEEQSDAVSALIEREIADIGMEIAGTDRQAFRDELKARRECLNGVLESIRKVRGVPRLDKKELV